MRQKLQDLLLIMIIGDNYFLILLIIASILETYLSTEMKESWIEQNFHNLKIKNFIYTDAYCKVSEKKVCDSRHYWTKISSTPIGIWSDFLIAKSLPERLVFK